MDRFVLFIFHVCLCYTVLFVAGKRADLLALLCVMFFVLCHFPIWYSGSVEVLDCIDS